MPTHADTFTHEPEEYEDDGYKRPQDEPETLWNTHPPSVNNFFPDSEPGAESPVGEAPPKPAEEPVHAAEEPAPDYFASAAPAEPVAEPAPAPVTDLTTPPREIINSPIDEPIAQPFVILPAAPAPAVDSAAIPIPTFVPVPSIHSQAATPRAAPPGLPAQNGHIDDSAPKMPVPEPTLTMKISRASLAAAAREGGSRSGAGSVVAVVRADGDSIIVEGNKSIK